ncbi:FAD:protein FMN transferase [Chlorobium phaeovibrioides]|uniref:FAD:protein FMN transferase n=2 Tax=Chlorobium phaeovibrioides TaxID=1094 RepID=A0A432AXN2_CHLPH|nr:FAD:protein FMN transferase [Chlorobium phaeovibrioides]RTY35060.1 FAD:protein FMN transferase [Chlorobium phaeovibrioides]RTY40066.1 FAD:protein FMN transferase [Chlorobium phaeovibrioides]HCD35556.1 FAD:protein FMN transferase [Chlorobium sp.]
MAHFFRHILLGLLPLSALLSCTPNDPPARLYEQEKVLMGTVFKFKSAVSSISEDSVRQSYKDAFREIARLESQLSEWIEESPVSRAAQRAGESPVPITPDILRVTDLALSISEHTDGAFDCTFLPLGELWNIRHRKQPPTQDSINSALQFVNWREVETNREEMTLFLRNKGMRIGFGGIGKGYAAKQAGLILEKKGITDYIIDAGGDLFVHGKKGSEPWTSGIQNPDLSNAPPVVRFRIKKACGIATSGGYENYFTWKGKRYHHIIDLKTGWPKEGMKSSTVFSADPAKADAYATAFYILGSEKSLEVTRRDTTVAFILIDSTGTIKKSPNLSRFIEE